MRSISLISCALLTLAACGGDKSGDSTTPTTGATAGTPGGTAGGTTSTTGFHVDVMAIDFELQQPVAEGICIELIDPSPALTGGAPLVLKSATVGPAGAVLFEDVVTDSVLGLLVSVKDCGTENQTVFTSATGIPWTDIRYLAEGETLSGVVAHTLNMAFVGTMQTEVAGMGFAGDMLTDGLVLGFVVDNGGAPVAGATLTCDSCETSRYLDGDAADGLFSTGATPNASTLVAGSAGVLIPGGPIAQYTADDGGTHSWEVQLLGSTPGSAVIGTFVAAP